MKCRYCGTTMKNKLCPFCGYSEQTYYDPMEQFRVKAHQKIVDIDFPHGLKPKKRRK